MNFENDTEPYIIMSTEPKTVLRRSGIHTNLSPRDDPLQPNDFSDALKRLLVSSPTLLEEQSETLLSTASRTPVCPLPLKTFAKDKSQPQKARPTPAALSNSEPSPPKATPKTEPKNKPSKYKAKPRPKALSKKRSQKKPTKKPVESFPERGASPLRGQYTTSRGRTISRHRVTYDTSPSPSPSPSYYYCTPSPGAFSPSPSISPSLSSSPLLTRTGTRSRPITILETDTPLVQARPPSPVPPTQKPRYPPPSLKPSKSRAHSPPSKPAQKRRARKRPVPVIEEDPTVCVMKQARANRAAARALRLQQSNPSPTPNTGTAAISSTITSAFDTKPSPIPSNPKTPSVVSSPIPSPTAPEALKSTTRGGKPLRRTRRSLMLVNDIGEPPISMQSNEHFTVVVNLRLRGGGWRRGIVLYIRTGFLLWFMGGKLCHGLYCCVGWYPVTHQLVPHKPRHNDASQIAGNSPIKNPSLPPKHKKPPRSPPFSSPLLPRSRHANPRVNASSLTMTISALL